MGFLLDTNVVSEPLKRNANPVAVERIAALNPSQCFLSTLTLGELRKGIESAKDATHKHKLESWLVNQLVPRFESRIHAIDMRVADRWGRMIAQTPRPLPLVDSLLAATALTHDLILATRNVRDFADIAGLRLYDPWTDA
ncbi:MAG: type II toxin-antitoxin system VapC family toxin [Rhizobacter sp.]|nr:type II toxin-antitoxin system VapC family toxin [Burkholderiales bacterium]